VSGGDGDDLVGSYYDRVRDILSCGRGADRVDADNVDVVGADCETRY
jgi:hypothetical protein